MESVVGLVLETRLKVFAMNLKPVYRKDPESFKKLHTQLVEQFRHHIYEEMECLYKEENIPYLMNQLDKLRKEKDPEFLAWRPSGEPEVDVQDHLIPVKIRQRNELQEILKTLESRNRLLQSVLKAKQKNILETSNKIEDHYFQVKEISDMLSGERMKTLEDFYEKYE